MLRPIICYPRSSGPSLLSNSLSSLMRKMQHLSLNIMYLKEGLQISYHTWTGSYHMLLIWKIS